jgi:dTDP-4-amino-4,6-dideoxygalactose transaminase
MSLFTPNSRLKIWDRYHDLLKPLEKKGDCRRPIIPKECQHNAHMYYVLMPDESTRDRVLKSLKKKILMCSSIIYRYIILWEEKNLAGVMVH